jgi:hypothetical protein
MEGKTGIGGIWEIGGTGGQPYAKKGEATERCDDSEMIDPRLLFRATRASEEEMLYAEAGRDVCGPALSDRGRLPCLELEGESFLERTEWVWEEYSGCLRGS